MFARLSGVGSFLPGAAVSNQDLVARGIDTDDEWIVTRTGIRSRHLAEPGQTASDLGVEAARRALHEGHAELLFQLAHGGLASGFKCSIHHADRV